MLLLDLDPRRGLIEGVGLANTYDADYHLGQLLLQDEEADQIDSHHLVYDRGDLAAIPANRRMDSLSDQLGQDRG